MPKEVIAKPVTYGGITFEPEGIYYVGSIRDEPEEESLSFHVVAHDDGTLYVEFEWLNGREFRFPSWQILTDYINSKSPAEPNVEWRSARVSEDVHWQRDWTTR